MPWRVTWHKPVLRLCVALHATGLCGLYFSPWRSFLEKLTPGMIVLTLAVAWAWHVRWSLREVVVLAWCGGLGYLAEVAGVQRGWIFGQYKYGSILGPALWDVPILLFLNWIWVLYGVQNFLLWLKAPRHTLAYLSAVVLVLYDLPLEHFAMFHGLWQWPGGHIPTDNFVGWGLVTLLLSAFWQPRELNRMAAHLFLLQFAFFILAFIFQNYF
ncbi:MAG: carotenoid biosynthesis protein [Flavobacteriales bacterium]|nr:carotenoid biosynthesis protein [Flavobacteriales bacterium]MDW8432131.1 carotenoid biosynthesis protein [Flavobacteriales bacterium]